MSKLARSVFASILLLCVVSGARAVTLSVDCGAKTGLTSIGAALKLLKGTWSPTPATINVSGDCRENVLVQNIDGLTLNAIHGATITDASDGVREVIDVDHSAGFTLSGFTIVATCSSSCLNGPGADGVDCYGGSDCLLINNTISGAANGAAVGVYAVSRAIVQGGTLQNNYYGLFTNDSGELSVAGAIVQNNVTGIYLNHGGVVSIHAAPDGVTASLIRNNSARGIDTNLGASVIVKAPAEISGNGTEGINLAFGTKLFVGGVGPGVVSVTGNAGSGVSINDVSIATFAPNAHVTGNGSTNISCNAPTVLTAGAVTTAGGAGIPYTNCAN